MSSSFKLVRSYASIVTSTLTLVPIKRAPLPSADASVWKSASNRLRGSCDVELPFGEREMDGSLVEQLVS